MRDIQDLANEFKKLSCDKLVVTLVKPTVMLKGWKATTDTLAQVKINGIDVKIKSSTSMDTVIVLTLNNSKASELLNIFRVLMSLHYLSLGYFPLIEKVELFSEDIPVKSLDGSEYMKVVPHFPTYKEYVRSELQLIAFPEAVKNIVPKFHDFEKLLEDLSIQLNILYTAISESVRFPEIRAAFLIELIEPFAEYEGLKKDDNTPLRESILKFVLYIGQEIFKTEIDHKIDFIPRMVQTRVNILHAKLATVKKKNGLQIKQVIVYNLKFQLLYRAYILRELGLVVNLGTAIRYAENPFDPSVGFDLVKSFN
jgi:hypothetical protein